MANTRVRSWCFTEFPSEDNEQSNEPSYDQQSMNYLVYGKETCPTTGKQHWQGFVQLKKATTRSATKSKFFSDGCHLEPMRGTPEQAANYCKKEGDFQEFGELSVQGKRKDLEVAKELIEGGAKIETVAKECFGVFCRYPKAISEYVQMQQPRNRSVPDDPKKSITILWGDAGSGKSRTATNCDDYQVIQYNPKSTFFSTAWDGSKRVIFDDVSAETFFPRGVWLNIFDPYSRQLQLNVKGGYSRFAPEEIVFTSNYDPTTWFPCDDAAWKRRLTEFCTIRHMAGFADEPMRRFFTTPVVTNTDTHITDLTGAESEPERGSPVDWAESSDDDSDISVYHRLVTMANDRAGSEDDYDVPSPRREPSRFMELECVESDDE